VVVCAFAVWLLLWHCVRLAFVVVRVVAFVVACALTFACCGIVRVRLIIVVVYALDFRCVCVWLCCFTVRLAFDIAMRLAFVTAYV